MAIVLNSDLKDLIFETEAATMTSVLLKTSSYRKRTIPATTELILTGMRPGKRSEFILEFKWVAGDANISAVEFDETTAFIAMPRLQEALINALGDYASETWKEAKSMFYAGFDTREKDRVKEVEKNKIHGYEDDPMWGMF
jgi:hypothetical protein